MQWQCRYDDCNDTATTATAQILFALNYEVHEGQAGIETLGELLRSDNKCKTEKTILKIFCLARESALL